MGYMLATTDVNKNTDDKSYDTLPDTCPYCHNAIEPIFKVAYENEHPEGLVSQVVIQCPRNSCRFLSIGFYLWNKHLGQFEFNFIKPFVPEDRIFSDEILKVSPDFIEIFNQAAKSEMSGWSQVAGCGYRKSIEYLIKDYVIFLEEDKSKHDELKAKWLSNVIKDHVSNDNVKTAAELATWLGNDETHYVRKWSSLDINDLKKLIELSVRWIEMEIMTLGYSDKMKEQETQDDTVNEQP